MGSQKTRIKFWLWCGKLAFLCPLMMVNKGILDCSMWWQLPWSLLKPKERPVTFPHMHTPWLITAALQCQKVGISLYKKALAFNDNLYGRIGAGGKGTPTMELAWQSYIGSLTWMVCLRFTDPACQVCEGTIQRKQGWISGVCAICVWHIVCAFPALWAWPFVISSCCW